MQSEASQKIQLNQCIQSSSEKSYVQNSQFLQGIFGRSEIVSPMASNTGFMHNNLSTSIAPSAAVLALQCLKRTQFINSDNMSKRQCRQRCIVHEESHAKAIGEITCTTSNEKIMQHKLNSTLNSLSLLSHFFLSSFFCAINAA